MVDSVRCHDCCAFQLWRTPVQLMVLAPVLPRHGALDGSSTVTVSARWASKRQSHSIKYYDRDTLRHANFTSYGQPNKLMVWLCSSLLRVCPAGPSGRTALHIAVSRSSKEAAALLLSKGADINAT
jgi:hypothetical protein